MPRLAQVRAQRPALRQSLARSPCRRPGDVMCLSPPRIPPRATAVCSIPWNQELPFSIGCALASASPRASQGDQAASHCVPPLLLPPWTCVPWPKPIPRRKPGPAPFASPSTVPSRPLSYLPPQGWSRYED
jgi:hypothetical protein